MDSCDPLADSYYQLRGFFPLGAFRVTGLRRAIILIRKGELDS